MITTRRVARYLAASFPIALSQLALAAPKLEDVFKSTNENFTTETDPTKIFYIVGAIVALFLLVMVLNRRSERKAAPKALNHRGKLMKEIVKQVHLKPAEMRQLRALAESQEVENPLALLLCPSVLAKAVKERPERVDRRALAGIIKRMS